MIVLAAILLAGQTQMQMDQAADVAFRRADAAMNVEYRATTAEMKKMDKDVPPGAAGPSYDAALLSSQRAWLKFRDAECLVEGYQYRGGTAEPMAASQCLARVTGQRTKQLKMIADFWNR